MISDFNNLYNGINKFEFFEKQYKEDKKYRKISLNIGKK